MNNSPRLCEHLPYWEFLPGNPSLCICSDGALAGAIEIVPLDIECFDDHRINQLTLGLRSFCNTIAEGLTAQVFVKVDSNCLDTLKQHADLCSTTNKFLFELDQDRVNRLADEIKDGLILKSRLYFVIYAPGPTSPGIFSFKKLKHFSEDAERGFGDRRASVAQALESAANQLGSLGFTVQTLARENLIDTVYKHFNPQRSQDHSAPTVPQSSEHLEEASPRSDLVFGDVVLDKQEFLLDSMRTRIITLKILPEATFAGMMSGFLSFPFQYELLFSFKVPDQGAEMNSLEQKRRLAHSLSGTNGSRAPDIESQSRLNQTSDLIKEIIETGQKIFHAELMIILRGPATQDGLSQLNRQTREVLSRFRALSGSEGVWESVGAFKIFKSHLPLAPKALVRSKKIKTNNLVDFLPLYGSDPGDERPVCLLKNRWGGLYSLDPFSPRLTNYNMLVTGSSGSGKSFASNFLLLQQIARGGRVFIIDVGGSYKKLTEVLGGQYFEINLKGDYRLNPFGGLTTNNEVSGEKIKSLVNIVEQMVVEPGQSLTRLERVSLESAITQMIEEKRRTNFDCSPRLRDLAKICKDSKDEELRKLARLLDPWILDSPYGKLLDADSTISSSHQIVTFDLKGLSQFPDLQSVVLLTLTSFILDQVEKDRSSQKRVLLDEAWELLKSNSAAQFMEYAARTFRKTGSGITFITQGVEEIVASPMGSAIFSNTSTKLVMMQKGDLRILESALRLGRQELNLVQSLSQQKGQYSEGFLMHGELRQVLRFTPTPLEYWISTSDSADNAYLAKLTGELGSLTEAVYKAAETAPYGIAHSGRGVKP